MKKSAWPKAFIIADPKNSIIGDGTWIGDLNFKKWFTDGSPEFFYIHVANDDSSQGTWHRVYPRHHKKQIRRLKGDSGVLYWLADAPASAQTAKGEKAPPPSKKPAQAGGGKRLFMCSICYEVKTPPGFQDHSHLGVNWYAQWIEVVPASALAQAEREASELRQAVVLMTTLHPTMEMDALHPLAMAQEIERYVRRTIAEQAETIKTLEELVDLCRMPAFYRLRISELLARIDRGDGA